MEERSIAPDQMIEQSLLDIFPLELLDEGCVRVGVQALEKASFFLRRQLLRETEEEVVRL
jgi:hypothetical protein